MAVQISDGFVVDFEYLFIKGEVRTPLRSAPWLLAGRSRYDPISDGNP